MYKILFSGIPKRFVDEAMEQGKDVILDIEVQGAIQVTSKRPDTVRIFIAPPSWAELERRLTERGTDSKDKIQKRLLRAKVEFQTAHTYDYFVINDTVENAVRELDAIMTAEHCKPKERMEIISGRETPPIPREQGLNLRRNGRMEEVIPMMLYPTMNKLTHYVPNRYMLVNVVARRARQIAETAEETGELLTEKPVTLAINEVAEGKLDASHMDLTIEEENA